MAKNNKGKKKKVQRKNQNPTATSILRNWWQVKNPVLLYALAFAALMIVFYAVLYADFFRNGIHPYLLKFNASISAFFLNLLGQNTQHIGSVISSSLFSIDIKQGCDALEPIALFAAIVLAYPTAIFKKFQAVLVATFMLFSLNIVRIVSLFLTGVYFENLFDLMHIDVWQFLFILFAILLCLAFIRWVNQTEIKHA